MPYDNSKPASSPADTSWNPLCQPPAPPCEPACQICRPNTGRDVETIPWEELAAFVTSGVSYRNSAGDRMAAPHGAILQALREAAVEFASDTRVLRRVYRTVAQKGVRDYYVGTLPDERVGLVNRVCVSGRCIDPSELGCCSTGDCCAGGGFVFEIPDKLVLDCAPTCDEECMGIEITYHAVPTEEACVFDRELKARYRQAMQYGALARLLTLPGWEWTRPDYGVNFDRKFQMEIAAAKIDAANSFASGRRSAIAQRSF